MQAHPSETFYLLNAISQCEGRFQRCCTEFRHRALYRLCANSNVSAIVKGSSLFSCVTDLEILAMGRDFRSCRDLNLNHLEKRRDNSVRQ
jgi:hypothetical protein